VYREALFKPLIKSLELLSDAHTTVVCAAQSRLKYRHKWIIDAGSWYKIETLWYNLVRNEF